MINNNEFWLNIILLALGTFLIRFSFIAFASQMKLTDQHKDLFSYIPAAVLPALIVPALFFHSGTVHWLYYKERLVVLLASAFIAYKYRNVTITLVFGLVLLWMTKQV